MRIAKNNKIIKDLKELQKTTKSNLIYVDDLSSIKTYIDKNNKVETFLYCDELNYHEDTLSLIEKIKSLANETYTISKQTYEALRLKENSAGLICTIKFINHPLDDLKNEDIIVVCDRLEIPGNIGTIYRTMEATQINAMILTDAVVKPQNAKLCQASRGANLLIPTSSVTYDEAQKWLLDNEYEIFLGEPNLGLSYKDYDYKGKIAIVVGHERFGINDNWYNHPHKKVYIPMFGSNNSLNVGVAASILIYEAKMNKESIKKSIK